MKQSRVILLILALLVRVDWRAVYQQAGDEKDFQEARLCLVDADRVERADVQRT